MNHFALAALCTALFVVPTSTFAQPPAATAPSADQKANARRWVKLGLDADKAAKSKDHWARLLDSARILHGTGDQAGALAYITEAETLVEAESLAPSSPRSYVRGIVGIVSTYNNIGEWDKALSFAKSKMADNGPTYAAVGEAQAEAKAPGAKATLLIAQTKAAEEESLLDRAELFQQVAQSFITLGAAKEAGEALALAKNALDKETDINVGIPKFERQIEQARLLNKAGQADAAQALLAQVEKDTLASPYVFNEQGLVLYRVAVAYRNLGKLDKAKAVADKAAPLIVKIESEGNEARMLRSTLIQQALAGQVTDAVARAKKGEYDLDPIELLTDMGEALGEAKRTTDAKTVFTEALTLNNAVPNAGARLMNDLNLAPAMAKSDDKAGADALFNDAAKRIPLVPEEKNRPAFWALWVEKRATSDLPTASAHINDTLPELRSEVYLALARAASQL